MLGMMQDVVDAYGGSQSKVAELMGESPVQVNRWINGSEIKSLERFMEALRRLARSDPERWMRFLATSKSPDFLAVMENVLYFTEDFPFPREDCWLIASEPAELTNDQFQKKIVDVFLSEGRGNRKLTYWVPQSAIYDMLKFCDTLRYQLKVPTALIKSQIEIIETPSVLSLISFAVFSPLSTEDKVPFAVSTSDSGRAKTLRTYSVAQETTRSIVKKLSTPYFAVMQDGEYADPDRALWRRVNPFSEPDLMRGAG